MGVYYGYGFVVNTFNKCLPTETTCNLDCILQRAHNIFKTDFFVYLIKKLIIEDYSCTHNKFYLNSMVYGITRWTDQALGNSNNRISYKTNVLNGFIMCICLLT